jgi:hypothetical protein
MKEIVQSKTRAVALFWVLTALGTLVFIAAYFDGARSFLAFLWEPLFIKSLTALLILGLFCGILKRITAKFPPRRWLQWVYGILFLPVVLLPVFRCYFKVPYVFCRACPSPCAWGILRGVAFPAFLLLNLFGKFWCTSLCPFGTFQECQDRVSPKRFKLPAWTGFFAYLMLFLVTGLYLLTLFDSSWVRWFETGRYAWMEVTVAVAALFLAVSFLIPKFFCRYFCPVSAIDRMVTDSQSTAPRTSKDV